MAPLTLLFRQLETQQLNGDGKPKKNPSTIYFINCFFCMGYTVPRWAMAAMNLWILSAHILNMISRLVGF